MAFDALSQLVNSAYTKELDQEKHENDISCREQPCLLTHVQSKIVVGDDDDDDELDETTVTTQERVVGKLELLQSWNGLLKVLQEIQQQSQQEGECYNDEESYNEEEPQHVYREYRRSLRQAFVDVESVDESDYRHLNTLIKLLSHTAENRDCDPSTQCRFVTLLEVALTYGPSWKEPSAEVSRLWVRLMQRIPANIGPMAFRRKAYRILVSLSWVPICKGLMEACSFEAKRRDAEFYQHEPGIAPGVRAQMARIASRNHHASAAAGSPLLLERHDGVHMLLDRLKDETDVCVAITCEQSGAGKTTLAALVASHPSILRAFKVLWLRLPLKGDRDEDCLDDSASYSTISTLSSVVDDDSKALTYDRYTKYLNDLCEQAGLNESGPVNWPICEKRFEEPALRKLREMQFMEAARTRMANLLRKALNGQKVLLVLDDVTDDEQIRWFRFNELQSMIITTTNSTLNGVDWNVPLDPVMTEDEATDLFLMEANMSFLCDSPAAWTVEVRDVVRKCEYRPLTIRTVARWYQMKQVTVGRDGGLQQVIAELDSLTKMVASSSSSSSQATTTEEYDDSDGETNEEDDDDHEQPSLLFDVLSLMMGPDRLDGKGTTVLFVLCFSAMVVIFPQRRVPLDVVIILWEQLMKVSSLAVGELTVKDNPCIDARKYAWHVAEGLLHMGVVTVSNDNDGKGRWIEVHHSSYAEFAMIIAKRLDLGDTFDEIRESWHKAFVTAYFEQRIQNTSQSSDQNSWEYAVEKLPAHIFQANMLSMAETILADDSYFRARVETMGWDRAVALHLEDCVQLQYCVEADLESSRDILTVSAVFSKTAAMIRTYASSDTDQVAIALYRIGFALAEQGYFEEALTEFESAQGFNPQSQGTRCCILYAISWVYLASGEGELALQNIDSCRDLLEDITIEHELYKEVMQLHADVVVGVCEYNEGEKMLSAIEQSLLSNVDNNRIELGTVYYRKGRLYHCMGDLNNAMIAFEESLKWKQDAEECSHSLAVVFSGLADVQLELDRSAAARANFDSAVRTLGRLDCDLSHISYLLVSGKSCLLKKDLTGGFASLEEAVESIEVAPLLLMDQSAYDLRCIAKAYRTHGNLNRAIEVLKKSLLLTSNREFSIERAWGLSELGQCLLAQGLTNQGLGCMEQSLQIQTSKLGECANIMNTLKTIGEVHFSLGELDEALNAFVKSLGVANRLTPTDTELIAALTFAIGEVYEAKNDVRSAMNFYMNSVEIRKNNGDASDSLEVSLAMQRMGNIQTSASYLDAALDYYKEAHRIRRMHRESRLEAETLHAMGVVHRRLGDFHAAQQCLIEALALKDKTGDCRSASATLLEIGNVYRLQGDPKSAESQYRRALSILVENDSNENTNELRGSLYLALGHSRLALGERDDAMEFYEQAHDVRVRAFGPENIRTASILRCLGMVNFLSGRQEQTMSFLTEFVRGCEAHADDDLDEDIDDDKVDSNGNDGIGKLSARDNLDYTQTLDYALAVVMLGDIHYARNNRKQAVRGWSLANKICAKRDNFEDRAPELANIIHRRLLEEDGSRLSGGDFMLTGDEREILQQIVFVDD